MSLLGRLEDLSLTDIIQIVFLSRRTGVLEIIDSNGRHSVVFQHGLIVNASSPATPDLGAHLVAAGIVEASALGVAKQAVTAGVPLGTAVVDMNLVTAEALGDAIRQHILAVITPLLSSRDGEFNFILSDSLSSLDVEYEPPKVFKEGGIAPGKILGEGEKLKPLSGLEESMRAGKALLRGSTPSPAAGKLDLGFSEDIAKVAPARQAPASEPEPEQPVPVAPPVFVAPSAGAPSTEAPFSALDEEPFDLGGGEEAPASAALDSALADTLEEPFGSAPAAPTPASTPLPKLPPVEIPAMPAEPSPSRGHATPQFKVTDAAGQPDERVVVLYQQDPLLRVSARRAFTRRGIHTSQYGSFADARNEIIDLLRRNRFFVSFLDIGLGESEVLQLLEQIKRRNHRLPVVVIDRVADLRRRHDLLKLGADLYLTKPSEGHLQPGMVEEQLALFADELVLFAQRAFVESAELAGGDPSSLYSLAGREKGEKNTQVLMQLINELSNPNDISQVSQTILRLAGQYLERGVVFAAATVYFVGLSGFGSTGGSGEMNERARSIRIGRTEPSVLRDVVEQRKVHRGKLRRTAGNERLIQGLGALMPSEVVVLPILNKDEVVGVLYGDNAVGRASIDETSGLEIFLAQSGFALRNAMIANRGRYGLE